MKPLFDISKRYVSRQSIVRTLINYLRFIDVSSALDKIFTGLDNKSNIKYIEFGPGKCHLFLHLFYRSKLNLSKAIFVEKYPSVINYINQIIKSYRLEGMANVIDIDVEECNNIKIVNIDEEFDLAVSSHIIEHLDSPKNHLLLIHRCLKDDGVLFLSTPNLDSQDCKKYGKNWRGFDDPTHISIMRYKELVKLVELTGFRVISSGTTPSRNLSSILEIITNRTIMFSKYGDGDSINIIAKKIKG